MSERIGVEITARDGASRVFSQVTSGLDRMERSLDSADRASGRFSRSGAAMGAALGAVTGVLSNAARAAAEAEVSQTRLQSSVEATGALYEEFAAQLTAAGEAAVQMAFDDEEAADALSYLTQATGDAQTAINDLGLVMDIARGRGIGLAEAAKIVAAAEQERFGALARIGIKLDENATKEEAIAALQARYAGQAAAYAETQAGGYDRWLVKLGNVNEALGEHTGQLQEVLMVLPGLSAGFTGVSAVLGGLAPMLGGPIGIAAAAGLAAVGIYKLWEASDGMVSSVDTANQHLGDLEQTVRELYAMGSTLGSLGERATEGIFPDLSADIAEIEDLQDKIAGTNAVIGQMSGADLEKANADLETWSFRLMEIADKYGILDASMLEATITQQDVIDGMDDLNAILANTGAGAAQAQEETAELFDQYERGEISAETLLSDLDLIANSFDAYNANATKAAEGTAQLTEAQQQYNMALAVANQTLEQYQQNQQIGGQNLAGEHEEMAAAIEKENAARDEANRAMQEYLDNEQQLAGASAAAFTAQVDLSAGIEAAADAMTYQVGESARLAAELAKQEEAVNKLKEQYADTFGQMQAAATAVADNLDTVFGAIVGNTDAIAKSAQGVMDWADALIGAEGTWAQIDDLLQNGAITLDEYTAAQGAYNQIATANASIQEDVLSIQAQLAPVVATATEALAAQMDEIANGSTDAQLFALGMMDAATSSQALALAQGYLENQEVFGPMIQQAAELNPMLAQILEEMGLISYNPATGEVKLLGVEESQSDIELLTEAMDELNETVATLIAILQDDASEPIGDVQNLLDDLDGDTATVFANLIDNASSGIAAAHNALMALDGSSATAYITTIQQTIGGAGVFALGGVAGYAAGGVVIRAGEAGMEQFDFPNGRHGLAVTDGLYTVPMGTYVHTAPATATKGGGPSINVTIAGNVYGIDDLERQLTRSLAGAWTSAMRMHERSYGAY